MVITRWIWSSCIWASLGVVQQASLRFDFLFWYVDLAPISARKEVSLSKWAVEGHDNSRHHFVVPTELLHPNRDRFPDGRYATRRCREEGVVAGRSLSAGIQ